MATDFLSTYWLRAGRLLGFTVEAPFHVDLPTGEILIFSARLPDFGATSGMLLTDHGEIVSSHQAGLVAAGYGYSVLSPDSGEPDLPGVVEVLQDWGWAASTPMPKWLRDA